MEGDDLIIKEALPAFYKDSGFMPDGGLNENSVKVELVRGISLYIPNFRERKKAVEKHDIHHLLTGYSTDLKGESEISTWELSTDCRNNWAAFALNLYGMMLGISLFPGRVWKAWLRGRNSENLYYKSYSREELMSKKVVDLKNELGLFHEGETGTRQGRAFLSLLAMTMLGLVFSVVSVLLVVPVLVYSIFIFVSKFSWKN